METSIKSLVLFFLGAQLGHAYTFNPYSLIKGVNNAVIGCKVALQARGLKPSDLDGPKVSTDTSLYTFSNKRGREPTYEVTNPKKITYPYEIHEAMDLKFRGLVLSPQELSEILQSGIDPRKSAKFRSDFADVRNAFELARVKVLQEKFKDKTDEKMIVVFELKPEAQDELKQDRLNPQFKYSTDLIPPSQIQRVLVWNPRNTEHWELIDVTENTRPSP